MLLFQKLSTRVLLKAKKSLKQNLLSIGPAGQEPSILLQNSPLGHITVQLYIQPVPKVPFRQAVIIN